MRVNSNLFWILAAFFWASDALYIVWTLVSYTQGPDNLSALTPVRPVEWVGVIGIGPGRDAPDAPVYDLADEKVKK